MAKAAKTSFALYAVIVGVIAGLFFVSKMAREGFQVMPRPAAPATATANAKVGPTGSAPPVDFDKAVEEVKKLANDSHTELLKKIDVVKSRHIHHGATGSHGPTGAPHK